MRCSSDASAARPRQLVAGLAARVRDRERGAPARPDHPAATGRWRSSTRRARARSPDALHDEADRVVRRRQPPSRPRGPRARARSPRPRTTPGARAEERVAQDPRRPVRERAEVRLEAERHRAPVADRLVDDRRAAARAPPRRRRSPRRRSRAVRRRREAQRRRGAVRPHHVARVPERVREAADARRPAGCRRATVVRISAPGERDPAVLGALERAPRRRRRRRPAPRRRASRRSGRRPRPRSRIAAWPSGPRSPSPYGSSRKSGSTRRVAVGHEQHVGAAQRAGL